MRLGVAVLALFYNIVWIYSYLDGGGFGKEDCLSELERGIRGIGGGCWGSLEVNREGGGFRGGEEVRGLGGWEEGGRDWGRGWVNTLVGVVNY